MSKEFTQERLEKMVVGEDISPNVVFFEKATLDHAASAKQKRRVYEKLVYMKRTVPGVNDWTAQAAQPKDIRDYPNEYQHFLENKQGEREPRIDMIPGLDIVALQELTDYGLVTLKKLEEAYDLPEHLHHIQKMAVRIRSLLTEEKSHGKANQESSKEITKETRAEVAAVPGGLRYNGDTDSSRSEDQRLEQSGHAEDRETGERLPESGRINRSQDLGTSNWSLQIG